MSRSGMRKKIFFINMIQLRLNEALKKELVGRVRRSKIRHFESICIRVVMEEA